LARGHDNRIHETPDASDIRNEDTTHEVSDVDTRAIMRFVLFLAIIIAVSMGLLLGMYRLFESWTRKAEGERPPMARTEKEREPPDPKLQGAPGFQIKDETAVLTDRERNLELKEPQAEMRAVRKIWEAELGSYGMVDRDQGMARIPIAEAMKIVAERGVQPAKPASGTQPKQSGQTTETMPSDSSSGRQTEQKQP